MIRQYSRSYLQTNMSCERCGSTRDLEVWVVEDPYYGYGHYPALRCKSCGVPDDWRYDGKHKYNPLIDDYHLGLTKKEPLGFCHRSGGPDPFFIDETCQDCKKPIQKDNKGWAKYLQVYGSDELKKAVNLKYGRVIEIIFCEPCALKRYAENRHSSEAVGKEILAMATAPK